MRLTSPVLPVLLLAATPTSAAPPAPTAIQGQEELGLELVEVLRDARGHGSPENGPVRAPPV